MTWPATQAGTPRAASSSSAGPAASGAVTVADELHGFNFDRAKARATGIFSTTRTILASARDEGVPPAVAADRLAERRISDVGRLGRIWLGR